MLSRAADPRPMWREQAARLYDEGYFEHYSRQQKDEVLRKGYLGSWEPGRALEIVRRHLEMGLVVWTPNVLDNLRDLGFVGPEARSLFGEVLEEARPEHYVPPRELRDPPGTPFIFDCKRLRCRLYLKIQVTGSQKKPRVLVWSCHPPVY